MPSSSSSSSKPRGSTPSASRSATQPEARPGRTTSKDSLKQKMAMMADDAPRPTKADEVRRVASPHNGTKTPSANVQPAQQLKALRTDFDSLRSHLTCKICDRLLYQPYTIACGHTYCYSVRPPAARPRCFGC